MALLSFDQIAEADDVTEEVISIPEWGGEVKVRGLTRLQVKDITRVATKKKGKDREINTDIFEKGLVFYGLVHPQITEDQYEVLLRKSSGAVQKIVDAVMRLSKMTDDEEEAEEGLKHEEDAFLGGSDSVPGISDRGESA